MAPKWLWSGLPPIFRSNSIMSYPAININIFWPPPLPLLPHYSVFWRLHTPPPFVYGGSNLFWIVLITTYMHWHIDRKWINSYQLHTDNIYINNYSMQKFFFKKLKCKCLFLYSQCNKIYAEELYYNHRHNILRIFVTLPNFIFITSEMKRDY